MQTFSKMLRGSELREMSLSKYVHVEKLSHDEHQTSTGLQLASRKGQRPLKTWKTSRRVDEKVGTPVSESSCSRCELTRRSLQIFLARELDDANKLDSETRESLLRLLNHPNLVNLADIIYESEEDGYNFCVWDYCDRGPLSRLLYPEGDSNRM